MLALVIVWLVTLQPTQVGALLFHERHLTDQEVAMAIEAGANGRLEARPLLVAFNDHVVGAVAYTPAVRIGLASRATRERGGELTVAQVPREWREPLVLIAMRSLPRNPDQGVSLFDHSTRVFLDTGLVPTPNRVDPVWVSFEPSSVLSSFGEKPAYADIALVAAFPRSALQAGWLIVGLTPHPPNGSAVWAVELGPEDISALR